uniref:carboxypeptidase-like regulatory domain-containing protein n=1 Tax=Algoriphagus sp. TaxID=1872435 RepID=UPI00258F2180|nr:carboxypeptidase-like regulatory domain-containing protein [Algoriphagus sp.]
MFFARFILFIFLLMGVGDLFSQTILGTVREKGSGLPLPFANVFISNTTLGKATDKDGKFRISGDLPQEIEVVASFVGYITEVKKISTHGKAEIQVEFDLAINESNLTEVQLKARRDKNWEREFRRFEEVFLALPDDPFKPKIEITNPWVVDFEKVKVQGAPNYVKATAQEPLKIINQALGYEVDYYLQEFRVSRGGSRFYGQVFYESMEDDSLNGEWSALRDENYYQPIRFLNQVILLNSRDTAHFRLYHALPERMDRIRTNDLTQEIGVSINRIAADSILRRPMGDGTFRIFLPGRMEVHHVDKLWRNDYYTNVYHAISWIVAPEGFYDVDRNGLLINPTQLILSGYLGRQRMARILPLDFQPLFSFRTTSMEAEIVQNPIGKIDRIREKVWLTTNKAYYYPGETAWIGGQMLYQEPSWSDSLSRVLYVDLLDQDSVYQSFIFPLEEGRVSGGFEIPKSLPAGEYGLRAYTNWSRNFPESDQFLLALPVLNPNLKPKSVSFPEDDIFGGVTVQPSFSISDSLSYRVMDLDMKFLDEFQNPIDTRFVFSLTDGEEVAYIDQNNDLDKALDWLDQELPPDFVPDFFHPIEFGISVRGNFIPDNRRRPLVQPITIVRGDLEDYGQVSSDSLGRFWATGMFYRGTAQIAVAAVNERRRPFGSIELRPFTRPNLPASIPKLDYKTEPRTQEARVLDTSGDYILLEEFVKEEVKERETMADRNYGYGTPNRELGEEELAKMGSWEQVFGKLALFSNYNYGEKTSPPLVILNGQKYPGVHPGEILADLVPAELESIKVYNDNISKSIFGMMGYGGVYMIETKKGFRLDSESDQKFNSEGFQVFSIPGFTEFTEFPNQPPADQLLKRKPTLYWNPFVETEAGSFKTQVKVPYGVKVVRIKLEGRTTDGEVISKVLELRL